MKIFHWMKYGKQTNLNSLQLNGTKLGPRFARASHNEHRHKFQSVLTKDYTQFFFFLLFIQQSKKKHAHHHFGQSTKERQMQNTRCVFIRISLSGYYVRKLCVFSVFHCLYLSLSLYGSLSMCLIRLSCSRVAPYLRQNKMIFIGVWFIRRFHCWQLFHCVVVLVYLFGILFDFGDEKKKIYPCGVNCAAFFC